MSWIFFALGAPLFFSATNHFDKYLLRRYFSDVGPNILIIFSSLVGLLVAPVIFLLNPGALDLSVRDICILIVSGVTFVLALLPYFSTLNDHDASLVVPLFQLIPVFAYGLAWLFLGETLSLSQILCSLIIVLGAVGMSLDLDSPKLRIRGKLLGLIMVSSILFSLDSVFFRLGATQIDFWVNSGWQYVGFTIPGLIFLAAIPTWRKQFFALFREKSAAILSLNLTNEMINLAAKLFLNFATLLAPVTLVWVMNGFQPFFVFVYGVLLTWFFPRIAEEDLRKKVVFQKIVCIIIMVIGAYFLQR